MPKLAKVKVVFPSVIANVTAGEREIEVSASTLREVIDRLVAKYGDAIRDRIFDSSGNLRKLLNFYVNGKNVSFLKQLETQLKDGDKILILPTVSGG
ncbi:molybdopterin synthase sulfur carrier subunit [Candidatus Bathyarchaeota archaeon]|nr:MAG: molybdopterin synthase sulfur carrier subunit [Candidatus Bathyarchaeota archaeon]